MRTVLILNPTSGSSPMAQHEGTPEQNEETILKALHTYGIEAELWQTTPEDSGAGLAKRAADEGVDLVIAAGGDGTIHAVASGLVGTKCMLGIIPLGTMNNIAHSLAIPRTIEESCAIIATGETSRIDVGTLNDQVFLEVAGVGLEAALFPAAEEIKRPGLALTLRGIIDGLLALFAYKPPRLKIAFDQHRTRTYRAIQVTVCNAPYYGAHLQVAPGILMDDGKLDVIIYRNFSKLEYIRYGISIVQGRRTLQPKITRRRVRALFIDSQQPVEIHADGVPKGHTPARIRVIPDAIHVRVPQKTALGPHTAETERKRRRQRDIEVRPVSTQPGATPAHSMSESMKNDEISEDTIHVK